ncbi:MAG: rhomboid family intramembrane serine protease [Desulfobacterales bacterium]|nr:rhomboid family intramembrane serine protease [Desulfobacterales bacterium]
MKRQSILCPNCNLLISTSEAHCPYCGVRSPAAAWRRLPVFRLLDDPALLVKTIVGANIVLYALALMLDPRAAGFAFNPLALMSPSDQSLFLLGASGTIPIDRYHRWWSVVSAGYLHAGLLHIIFNMAALRQLAAVVAGEFGPKRMFVIYTGGSVGGFVVSYLAGVPLTVGASAGVCGLVGAALLRPQPRRSIRQRAVPAGGRVGGGDVRVRVSRAGHQQLGARRRDRGRRAGGVAARLHRAPPRGQPGPDARGRLPRRHRARARVGGSDGGVLSVWIKRVFSVRCSENRGQGFGRKTKSMRGIDFS